MSRADMPTPTELGNELREMLHKSINDSDEDEEFEGDPDDCLTLKVENLLNEGAALMFAADCRDVAVCRLLLDHGADLNHENRSRFTPLICAANSISLEVCELFLDRCATVNSDLEGSKNALLYAVEREDIDICKLLLSRGAEPSSGNPLELAAKKGNEAIFRLLFAHGFRTTGLALMRFCISGQLNLCSLLLESGADVMVRGGLGATCLHGAAIMGHLDVCCLLLAYRADVYAVDEYGRTALDLAKEHTERTAFKDYKHDEIIAMLEEHEDKDTAEASNQSLKRKRMEVSTSPTPIYDAGIALVEKIIAAETRAVAAEEKLAVVCEERRNEKREAKATIEAAEARLEVESEERQELEAVIKRLEKEKSTAEASLEIKARKQQELESLIDKLEREKVAAETKVEKREVEYAELRKVVRELEETEGLTEAKLDKSALENKKLRKIVEQLKEEKAAAQTSVSRILRPQVVVKQEPHE